MKQKSNRKIFLKVKVHNVFTQYKYLRLGFSFMQQKECNDTSETKAIVNKEVEISPELLIKHPLQNAWTLWFYKNDKQKAWEENLRAITTFDTVEDFWAYVGINYICEKFQTT